ncbi:hypothetical protein NMG60_11000909 [Bertholletia excelsa]
MASSFAKWLVDPGRTGSQLSTRKLCAIASANTEALNRLPREVVLARNQRLKRAMDLSMKHERKNLIGYRRSGLILNSVTGRCCPWHCCTETCSWYCCSESWAMQTPFRSYLQEMLAYIKRENAEREAYGALPLCQRTLP